MKGLLIPIIIVVVLVIIGLWLAGTYNKLVRKRNNAKEGFSTMDVYLKKRFDMIPNLVETVKGYATHERETLEAVMKARSQVATSGTFNQKVEHENMLTGALGRLFAVAENYPDLKANQNFLNLQEQLKSVEQDIANARKFYNGTVKDLNNSIEQFPSNIVAGLFHFEKMPMFEINEESRENVQVKF
ncbi:MAG: LemA family protein [Clostridiales bacterium]|nr:LemA family protein [Clostridiales bacterium]MDY6117574.1 LemA family protein [Anaerovoracaceae bacterium]